MRGRPQLKTENNAEKELLQEYRKYDKLYQMAGRTLSTVRGYENVVRQHLEREEEDENWANVTATDYETLKAECYELVQKLRWADYEFDGK